MRVPTQASALVLAGLALFAAGALGGWGFARAAANGDRPPRVVVGPAAERMFAMRLDSLQRRITEAERVLRLRAQAEKTGGPIERRYAALRRRERAVADSALRIWLRLPSLSPVDRGRITSTFTEARLHPLVDNVQPHQGVDIAAPAGTPVHSTAAGLARRFPDPEGYGLRVDVDHGQGFVTRYAHLSATRGRFPRRVRRGEVIGLVGSTGRSTGPHVHYEVLRNGQMRDPAGFLAVQLDSGQLGVGSDPPKADSTPVAKSPLELLPDSVKPTADTLLRVAP